MSWHRKHNIDLERNRDINKAGMALSGFEFDKGRTLSAEEIQSLAITPLADIPGKTQGPYHWNRGFSI